MAIQVEIRKQKQTRKTPHKNYAFELGLGMYDPTTAKYIGLDQRAEDAAALGMSDKDIKEIIERQIAEKNKPLKVGKTTVTIEAA